MSCFCFYCGKWIRLPLYNWLRFSLSLSQFHMCEHLIANALRWLNLNLLFFFSPRQTTRFYKQLFELPHFKLEKRAIWLKYRLCISLIIHSSIIETLICMWCDVWVCIYTRRKNIHTAWLWIVMSKLSFFFHWNSFSNIQKCVLTLKYDKLLAIWLY